MFVWTLRPSVSTAGYTLWRPYKVVTREIGGGVKRFFSTFAPSKEDVQTA